MEINSPTQDDKLVEGSPPPGKPPAEGMVWIPGGTFLMGSDRHYPEEAPAHKVTVNGFWMDRYAVTNADFRRFVEATRYVTLAERPANAADYPGAKPELLEPSAVVFRKTTGPVDLRNPHNWWTYVRGADWRHPQGPGSTAPGAMEASGGSRRLRGRRSVCEVGRKGAADGSRVGVRRARRRSRARSTRGATSSRPAGSPCATPGRASSRGRTCSATATSGQHRSAPFRRTATGCTRWRATSGSGRRTGIRNTAGSQQACCTLVNPRGGEAEQSYDPRTPNVRIPRKVMKGGSYLCAPNYCRRYRPAARMAQPVDTAIGHLGFRCIVRVVSASTQ